MTDVLEWKRRVSCTYASCAIAHEISLVRSLSHIEVEAEDLMQGGSTCQPRTLIMCWMHSIVVRREGAQRAETVAAQPSARACCAPLRWASQGRSVCDSLQSTSAGARVLLLPVLVGPSWWWKGWATVPCSRYHVSTLRTGSRGSGKEVCLTSHIAP